MVVQGLRGKERVSARGQRVSALAAVLLVATAWLLASR
jgi:hypothetical protein